MMMFPISCTATPSSIKTGFLAAGYCLPVFQGNEALMFKFNPCRKRDRNSFSRSSSSADLYVNNGKSFINNILDQPIHDLMKSDGPPRWFSPLECAGRSRSIGSPPLLLFLPGIDGDGLGLTLHHKSLGEVFDIWCLHIPLTDRTPFTDLVMLVQSTIKSELESMRHHGPIYLVGESLGASLAFAVAVQNPEVDLILILANPAATCFGKSLLQSIVPLSEMIKDHLDAGVLHKMISMPETFFWKLKILHELQDYLNSHLHAVKAQTLILNSGKDMLLPGIIEGETLNRVLPNCEIRSLIDKGHPLFLEDSLNLLAIIKSAGFYRRGTRIDYVKDFLPLSPSEFKTIYEPFRWTDVALNPVMFSTMDSGKIVRGLEGVPSEGPILLVGNHMMIGLDAILIASRFWTDRNIKVRGMAHPFFFTSWSGFAQLNVAKALGGVPVSASNLYRLFSLKSHVLLYPGGIREALHRKGEEYKLIWPDEPEFVRMAARFGAKIIPFAVVGEDDVGQLMLDFDDQMKIPPLKAFIEELNNEVGRLRTDAKGDIGNQLLHYPLLLPKLPGRYYFLFGKPIATEGLKDALSNKDKACGLYSMVKTEIQKSIVYLKERRDKDPYRNILPRLVYQAYHGFNSEVPTFEI